MVAVVGLPADDGLGAVLGMPGAGFWAPDRVLRRLAAPDALLNIIDARQEIRDGVDDVVRSALMHASIGASALESLFLLRKRFPLFERQPDFVAADGKANGPHPRIEAFLDTGYGIVHLNARLHGGDFQVDSVLQAHVRVGPARWHIRRAHSGVRLV